MAAPKKKELMKVPGASRGVRETSGLRTLKMCRPICPNSKIEMEQDTAGTWRRVEKGPDQANCQLEGGQWWKACEALGHEPYWTTTVWYTKREITAPILDDAGNDTGEVEVVKVARIPHTTRRPNLSQVAIARNINNGRGPQDAIERKGFKYLGTLGFEEVCQYRNCQKPVDEKRGVMDHIGRYCSRKHLELVGMVHGQDFGAPAIRLVNPGMHKEATIKQRNLRRAEFAEGMSMVEGLAEDGI